MECLAGFRGDAELSPVCDIADPTWAQIFSARTRLFGSQLVRSRLLGMVDHEAIDRTLGRLEIETELLLNGSKD